MSTAPEVAVGTPAPQPEVNPGTPAASEEAGTGFKAFADQWAAFFDALVPPDDLEIEDVTGAKHRVRSRLPAAVEHRIARYMHTVGMPAGVYSLGSKLGALSAKRGIGNASDVLDGVVGLFADEAVVAAADELFAMAHPGVLRRAAENVLADEGARQYLPDGATAASVRASSVFSAADIVSALVPFVARAVSKVASTAKSVINRRP